MAELQPPLTQSSACRCACQVPAIAAVGGSRIDHPDRRAADCRIVTEIIEGRTSTVAAVVEINLAADVREPRTGEKRRGIDMSRLIAVQLIHAEMRRPIALAV